MLETIPEDACNTRIAEKTRRFSIYRVTQSPLTVSEQSRM